MSVQTVSRIITPRSHPVLPNRFMRRPPDRPPAFKASSASPPRSPPCLQTVPRIAPRIAPQLFKSPPPKPSPGSSHYFQIIPLYFQIFPKLAPPNRPPTFKSSDRGSGALYRRWAGAPGLWAGVPGLWAAFGLSTVLGPENRYLLWTAFGPWRPGPKGCPKQAPGLRPKHGRKPKNAPKRSEAQGPRPNGGTKHLKVQRRFGRQVRGRFGSKAGTIGNEWMIRPTAWGAIWKIAGRSGGTMRGAGG